MLKIKNPAADVRQDFFISYKTAEQRYAISIRFKIRLPLSLSHFSHL